ncbi:MAG: type II secretion system F family protein [Acidimicrobiia bacterium]|jgi:type IV pilus assembly protein PilC|nr:MAG: type II secretion system F family protein [Acidimicrobiia bacterium]
MTTYAYKAQDTRGKVKSGQVKAASTAEAERQLKGKGMQPISIEESVATGLQADINIPGITNRVALKDITVFSRQFATMINSGLSLLRALAILAEQTENKTLSKTILEVKSSVEQGHSLSQSMAQHPKIFNHLYVAMVRAGETGGVLDDSLNRLAETLEKQMYLKQKIKSAMMYPVAVLVLVILIVAAMLIFIVPMFVDLYADLEGELPAMTKLLIGLSDVLVSFWYLVLGGTIGAYFGFRAWKGTDKGRRQWDRIKLKMPVFGKLVHKTAIARFSHTLSGLITTGVPILQAMEIVGDTSGNAVVEDALMAAKASVSEGESIAGPLAAAGTVFPPMVVQMVSVGEETGALDQMLERIGTFYDQEVDAMVEGLTSLIEPILIVFMGGAVGGILVSLYLPMFNIVNLI